MVTYQQTEVVPRNCNSRPQELFLWGESFLLYKFHYAII
ncbi:hypothetical protein II1_05688 [Bacillus cereus MC118]|uniref:Uncharacterized protein n=1 Tax=Bacillus cereus MC67 TaxID=1053219 RepID=J8EJV3_BACCE|nr:hypothetical protein II3_04307 [Bacillus cereus MC67]EOO97226.1 hypothetical protein II1_05688 [Bacillus cereus MC118]